jgi:hypothetical protein
MTNAITAFFLGRHASLNGNMGDGAIKPTLHGCGDVFGCGLVLSTDNKLAIFFTTNGILMGQFSRREVGRIEGEFTLLLNTALR